MDPDNRLVHLRVWVDFVMGGKNGRKRHVHPDGLFLANAGAALNSCTMSIWRCMAARRRARQPELGPMSACQIYFGQFFRSWVLGEDDFKPLTVRIRSLVSLRPHLGMSYGDSCMIIRIGGCQCKK